MKVIKQDEDDTDKVRVGIADNKTMTTTVGPEKLEGRDVNAVAMKFLDDFKAGKWTLSG